jgi:hypothetical protein
MRYNTVNKREKVKQEVIDYLTDYGYDKLTAEYEVNLWISGGLSALVQSAKESIKYALNQITYNKSL